MAKVRCVYSGLVLNIPHIIMYLHDGYIHPVFYLDESKLLSLYTEYCTGNLNHTDSYLLYLALLNSTGAIQWRTPAKSTHQTATLIANNIKSLVKVIHQTNAITLPRFQQPKYSINSDTCTLESTANWIKAWKQNIVDFENNYAEERQRKSIAAVEHKVTYAINELHATNSTTLAKDKLASSIAAWASVAGDFPEDVDKNWQRIIRSCYNHEKMFYTSKDTIKAIREHCYNNIEAGSVHFHLLIELLNGGIQAHNDFLDLPPLADEPNFSLQPTGTTEEKATLAAIRESAPTEPPIKGNYPTQLAFIQARLAYMTAQKGAK